VFGGPPAYSEKRGGHATLIRAHAGYAITEPRERWVELMLKTARETLPVIPELHEQLAAYFNWGTKIAVAASQPGFVDDRSSEPVGRALLHATAVRGCALGVLRSHRRSTVSWLWVLPRLWARGSRRE
jgi:hypothetical protein